MRRAPIAARAVSAAVNGSVTGTPGRASCTRAGVAEARLLGGAVMPLDDGYLMAVLAELIRSGQRDHAGTDDDLHVLPRCHDADLVGWFV